MKVAVGSEQVLILASVQQVFKDFIITTYFMQGRNIFYMT